MPHMLRVDETSPYRHILDRAVAGTIVAGKADAVGNKKFLAHSIRPRVAVEPPQGSIERNRAGEKHVIFGGVLTAMVEDYHHVLQRHLPWLLMVEKDTSARDKLMDKQWL